MVTQTKKQISKGGLGTTYKNKACIPQIKAPLAVAEKILTFSATKTSRKTTLEYKQKLQVIAIKVKIKDYLKPKVAKI